MTNSDPLTALENYNSGSNYLDIVSKQQERDCLASQKAIRKCIELAEDTEKKVGKSKVLHALEISLKASKFNLSTKGLGERQSIEIKHEIDYDASTKETEMLEERLNKLMELKPNADGLYSPTTDVVDTTTDGMSNKA